MKKKPLSFVNYLKNSNVKARKTKIVCEILNFVEGVHGKTGYDTLKETIKEQGGSKYKLKVLDTLHNEYRKAA